MKYNNNSNIKKLNFCFGNFVTFNFPSKRSELENVERFSMINLVYGWCIIDKYNIIIVADVQLYNIDFMLKFINSMKNEFQD